jgi:catechol-2,3-dioxygenase
MSMRLWKLGHVLLRVSDEEKARWFYCDVLGLKLAERDPEHGGLFTTLGQSFHTLDVAKHPDPNSAQKPSNNQLGLVHLAFQVEQYADLKTAYETLLKNGIPVERAIDHESQRSLYFHDPDGNGVEIYFELPMALQIYPNGRHDIDAPLPVGGPDDPIPSWLDETWPGPDMQAQIDALKRQPSVAVS